MKRATTHFVKPERNDGESKLDYDARVEAAEAAHKKAEVDAEAKVKYDAEEHDVSPENVIRDRPTRVILEYPDGHVVEVKDPDIQNYQGLSPASSDQYAGVIELRLKVNTSGYKRKEMGDLE